MTSGFVQGLDREASSRLQRLLSENPPSSGHLLTSANVVDTQLVKRCLQDALSADPDSGDYSVISLLGTSRLNLSEISDSLFGSCFCTDVSSAEGHTDLRISAADSDMCDEVVVMTIPCDSSQQSKTQAALAVCLTDLVVLCIDAQTAAPDLQEFVSLVEGKSVLNSMQPGAFTAAFGNDCVFCTPVVLLLYNAPWPISDDLYQSWQQKLQACWEETPKSAAVQQVGMQGMFKISYFALPDKQAQLDAFDSQCKWLRFNLTNDSAGGSGYLPAIKTSCTIPPEGYPTFLDTCWQSLYMAREQDASTLTRTFTGLFQAKQEADVMKICQERRAAELVRFSTFPQWVALRDRCKAELVTTFKADVDQLITSFEQEFSSSLSRNAAVSEAVLKEQTSQLRSAMLTMIKTEAFQPQMRLCSKTVLSAAKIAIASKESPIAHQVSLEAKAVQDLKAQFCSKRPETVTSLDPAFLERIASLKVHVGEEVHQADISAKMKAKMANRPQTKPDARVQKLQEQYGKLNGKESDEQSYDLKSGAAKWPIDHMEKLGEKQAPAIARACAAANQALNQLPAGWGGDVKQLANWMRGQKETTKAAQAVRDPPPAVLAQGKTQASGPHMIKVAAGVASVLFIMPKLLAMIQDDKATSADVCKLLADKLGPQVFSVVRSAVHQTDFKQYIIKALGPLAHTAIANVAMLAVELILAYIRGELDADLFHSVLSRLGVRVLLECLAIAFPPAAMLPLLLFGASLVWQALPVSFTAQVEKAIKVAVEFLAAALPLAYTAAGFALVAFGTSTPLMVMTVGAMGAAASTGTAISTLSGAAATNAALAWLGGGTIAAGGGGMAAGAMVMSAAATGGAAIAVGGIAWLGYTVWKKINEPDNVSEALIRDGLIAK